MYADLTLPAKTWHSWISEATSTGDHAAIISYEAALKAWLADGNHRGDCAHCPVYGRTGKTCTEAITNGQCQVTGRYHYNNRSNQHGVLHISRRVRNAAR